MAITTSFANAAKLLLMNFVASDTFKIALYTTSATLDATTASYSSTNETSGTGYTAAGNTLSGTAVSSGSGQAWIDWSDSAWTTASFSAAGCEIYNTTRSNGTFAVFDFGGNQTVSAGTFTIVFPAAAAGTAVIRLV